MAMPPYDSRSRPPPAKRAAPMLVGTPPTHQCHTAFGRPLALIPDEELAGVPHSAQQPGSSQSSALAPTPTRPIGCIQTLADDMLSQLLACLSFATHSQCAQVCQQWHSCLPATRERLAHALAQKATGPAEPHQSMAAAGSSHTRSRQSAGQDTLSQRDLQHLELLRLQKLLQQKRREPADNAHNAYQQLRVVHRLLSELERYTANHVRQQAMDTRPLIQLPPVLTPIPTYNLISQAHSSCGRWLATREQASEAGKALLHIYGWNCAGGQEEVLAPTPEDAVSHCTFSDTEPDTLFSAHQHRILVWRRAAQTGAWDSTQLHVLPEHYLVWYVDAMNNGDLVAVCDKPESRDRYTTQLLFFCFLGRERGWQQPECQVYKNTCGLTHRFRPLAVSRQAGLLALGLYHSARTADHSHRNGLHIWHRKPGVGQGSQWQCELSVFNDKQPRLDQMHYSPDGRLLLTLFADGNIWLLAQDAQHRPHRQLMLGCDITPHDRHLASLADFRKDGQQLAQIIAPETIQICDKDERGIWIYGQVLRNSYELDDPSDECLSCVRLSSSGRTLVCGSRHRVTIWQHEHPAGWQRVVERRNRRASLFPPQIAFLGRGANEEVASTAEDPVLSLWIHGPDSQGRLVRKDSLRINTPLKDCNASAADGRSLLFAARRGPGFLMQLCSSTAQRCETRISIKAEPL
ncbi:MAG: hypothetical protein OXC07_02485 [Kistimonas sp.]|nr:hypothetical protein [Kistimonas sp.]